MEFTELEIVFSGLCSFLNLQNDNRTMPNPSVVLVDTPPDNKHTPFIAYDTRTTSVSSPGLFKPVDKAPGFAYWELDNVELILRNDAPGFPIVTPSYNHVVRKDDYWPEAKDIWYPNVVPKLGEKPKPDGAAAFMEFGGGVISAERTTDFEWAFYYPNGEFTGASDYYAQEVLYRVYPLSTGSVLITVLPFGGGTGTNLTFTSILADYRKVKIWIGNNDKADIYKALLRLSSQPKDAKHFQYLNTVSYKDPGGPYPRAIVPKGTFPAPGTGSGGGADTGYCGPHNGNGG